MKFAECYIDTPIPTVSTFTYQIPERLMGLIDIGSVVLVPLRNRRVKGLVVGLSGKSAYEAREIISSTGKLPHHLLSLIRFISDESLTPVPQVLKAALPTVPVRTSPANSIETKQEPREFSKRLIYGRDRFQEMKEEIKKCVGAVLILVPNVRSAENIAERLDLDKYTLFHSDLAAGAKNRIWQDIEQGRIKILIGTRSALFLPFSSLSLIIVEKEEDFAYYSEMRPYISYVAVAIKLAELISSPILLGAVSPRIETMHLFSPTEIRGKNEDTDFALIKHDEATLSPQLTTFTRDDFPILIYVHRRGTSTARICEACGNATKCENCGIAMVLHKGKQSAALVCHHCNTRTGADIPCPVCGKNEFYFIGAGSQKFESSLNRTLSGYKVLRVDKDSPHLHPEADIVVATKQILYLDTDIKFKKIIVPLSDLPLSFPDFRSKERFYQEVQELKELLHVSGKIIFQTMNPDDEIFEIASRGDHDSLLRNDLESRKILGWPPYTKLIKISQRGDIGQLTESLDSLKTRLLAILRSEKGVEVLGPTPSLVPKQKGKFVGFITLKLRSEIPSSLRNELMGLPRSFKIEVDPLYLV